MLSSFRPFKRLVALAFAAAQLATSAGAPVLEAFAAFEDSIPSADGTSLRTPPKHEHDASTCPVCRLLDSPARAEFTAEVVHVNRTEESRPIHEAGAVPRLPVTGFNSRAPPTPLC